MKRTRMGQARRVGIWGAVAAAVALTGGGALAQTVRIVESGPGLGRLGEQGFTPPVSRADVDLVAQTAKLTPAQIAAVNSVRDAVNTEFLEHAKVGREKLEAARKRLTETQNLEEIEAITKINDEMRRHGAEAFKAFMEDVELLLEPEQADHWPAVQRAVRRVKTINRGLLAGERADVIAITSAMDLSEDTRAALAETLEQYALELDSALIARNAASDAMGGGPTSVTRILGAAQGAEAREAEPEFRRWRDAALRVRELNRRYARIVEGHLPEEKRADFSLRFRRAAFPSVHMPTYTDRILDTAMKFDDLQPTQRQTLEGIRSAYQRSMAAINERLETATLEEQSSATGMDTVVGARHTPSVHAAWMERSALQEETNERVRAALREEQRAKLPERQGGIRMLPSGELPQGASVIMLERPVVTEVEGGPQ